MNKKALSERDICSKFITPALKQTGWDEFSQIHEEVSFAKGRMAFCNRPEAQLTTTQTQSRHLLESALHQAIKAA